MTDDDKTDKIQSPQVHFGIGEGAAYLGVSKQTMKRILDNNEIPHRKIGGVTFLTPENIDKWLRCNGDE